MSEIKLIEVNDSSLDADNDNALLVKSLGVGPDVQTPTLIAPYGDDSVPIKGVRGVQADTLVNGDPVLIGVINIESQAKPGEKRLYATDADGNVLFYLWLKDDGTLWMGGDADNAVRFSPLKDGFDQLVKDFNNLVSAFNTLVTDYGGHTHTSAAPGSATSGPIVPTTASGVDSAATIDDAKIKEIKTL